MIDAVLIFGGSGDIGKDICKTFLKEGYKVFASYNTSKPNIKDENIIFFHYDTRSMNDFFEIFSYDIYNVIGIFFCIGVASKKNSIIDTQIDEFLMLNEINAISFIKIVQELYSIIERCESKVIVFNSEAIFKNNKNSAPYSASKSYLHSIVLSLNNELVDKGFKIKEIFLPPVSSRMMRKVARKKGYTDFEEYIDKVLKGRILNTDEIALACKKYIMGDEVALDVLLQEYLQ
ncbi:MAG: SDR family oxidoreductase [Lachnospiraceae bacterium]|nr:SDR family oxidoreductase [Lachnospiraceae bacterium]